MHRTEKEESRASVNKRGPYVNVRVGGEDRRPRLSAAYPACVCVGEGGPINQLDTFLRGYYCKAITVRVIAA